MDFYSKIKDGMTFTLTEKDIAPNDNFLIFNTLHKKQKITLHLKSVPFWVEFDGDEPIRLEDCPNSFKLTLLLNIERGNYSI